MVQTLKGANQNFRGVKYDKIDCLSIPVKDKFFLREAKDFPWEGRGIAPRPSHTTDLEPILKKKKFEVWIQNKNWNRMYNFLKTIISKPSSFKFKNFIKPTFREKVGISKSLDSRIIKLSTYLFSHFARSWRNNHQNNKGTDNIL